MEAEFYVKLRILILIVCGFSFSMIYLYVNADKTVHGVKTGTVSSFVKKDDYFMYSFSNNNNLININSKDCPTKIMINGSLDSGVIKIKYPVVEKIKYKKKNGIVVYSTVTSSEVDIDSGTVIVIEMNPSTYESYGL